MFQLPEITDSGLETTAAMGIALSSHLFPPIFLTAFQWFSNSPHRAVNGCWPKIGPDTVMRRPNSNFLPFRVNSDFEDERIKIRGRSDAVAAMVDAFVL
jgi:hypothetical protein